MPRKPTPPPIDRVGPRATATLPVPSDVRRLLARLAVEERDLVENLARLESHVRRFEDLERPAYASWLRLEFGPLLTTLDELSTELRSRRILADHLADLVEREGLHPREALHVLTHPAPRDARARRRQEQSAEVEARRRAKLERKRATRRESMREKRASGRPSAAAPATSGAPGSGAGGEGARARIVELYRALARRLHPDSPSAIRSLAPDRLGAIWTEVQGAYESRSLDRLLALSAWIESEVEPRSAGGALPPQPPPASRPGLLSLSERYDRLRALRRSGRALERRLSRLEADPAWGFADATARHRRRLAGRARVGIEDAIHHVRQALRDLEDSFDSIGPPRAPRATRRR